MREYRTLPRAYELMVLLNPEINDEALTTAVDELSGVITGAGGDVTLVKRDAPWGRRRLAYPIQRFRDATYILYQFDSAPARVRDMERDLKLDERVIRYLLVRHEEDAAVDEEGDEGEVTAEAGSEALVETESPEVSAEAPEETESPDADEAGEPEEATEEESA